MKDQNIELPPLPEGLIGSRMTKTEIRSLLKRYGERCIQTAIEPYLAEVERLQRIIDSRPAINAGLPQTYIDWSHSIYQMDAARVLETKQ